MPSFKDTAKPWFQTQDKPTQEQFYQLFDYLRFKDEPIDVGDLSPALIALLNSLLQPVQTFVTVAADHPYTIAAGFVLEDIIVMPVADCSPYVETVGGTPGDLASEDPELVVTPAVGYLFQVKVLAIAARNILVKGVPIGSTLKFVRRKI